MNQVAQLDLVVEDGRVVDHAFSLHAVTASSPRDEAVERALEPYAPRAR